MANFIVILILLLLVGGAVRYIVKAKKQGVKCIGCSSSGSCGSGSCASCSGGTCNSCAHGGTGLSGNPKV